MKAIVCEMCGDTNLMKQDGVFVCQSCGTKYTVEEAKKMMIEGTVDVTGSKVKVDTEDRIANLYILARRSKEEGNDEDAGRYYNEIAIERPYDWEAQFYKVFLNCRQTTIANIGNSCVTLSNTLDGVVSLLKNAELPEDDKKNVLTRILLECTEFATMTSKVTIDHSKEYSDVEERKKFIAKHYQGIFVLGIKVGDLLQDYIDKDAASSVYELSLSLAELINEEAINIAVARLKMVNPDFQYGAPKTNVSTTSVPAASSGCYVATCVYGSYDCPEVWTLRRYRDYNLAKTWQGRVFIHTYYAISPTIVDWFGNTRWFKKMWKNKLDHMVHKLQQQGYEATPYKDQKW